MNKCIKVVGLSVAAVALTAECVLIPSEANALGFDGPPTHNNGAYYSQGDVVNLCIGPDDQMYGEAHSDVLANCGPGYTQLSVEAIPSSLAP